MSEMRLEFSAYTTLIIFTAVYAAIIDAELVTSHIV